MIFFFPDDPEGFRFNAPDEEEGTGGLNVVAIIPGATNSLGVARPSWYGVYRTTGMSWYLKALDVTLEMIDWVLAQEKPEQFWLAWSS